MTQIRLHSCVIRIAPGLAKKPFPGFVIADGGVKKIAAPWKPGLVLPSGEAAKSLRTVERIVRALVAAGHERTAPVIAIGGGVACDVVGFAAAIYKRGVPVYFVPTTLLAQVDAAIGGKNGVDLPEGKNLLGVIRQPVQVLIDPSVLESLPPREFKSGLAEIVKCGVIRDPVLFEMLEQSPGRLPELIRRAVKVKVDVVTRDENETGERAILNYGHTIGHAIESASHYRLRHGEAISIGMEAAAYIAWRMNLAGAELLVRQNELLVALGLPTRLRGVSIPAVMAALKHDKKRAGGIHRFVLPERIGRARIGVPVEEKLIAGAIGYVSQ